MTKYLMRSAAALLIGMAVTGCSHDLDYDSEEAKQALDNAEATLGFHIPETQDWVMTAIGTTSITVNGDYGANYEVLIYQNNPFINNTGTVLAKGSVISGGTMVTEFRYPKGMTTVYAAIKDEKGYTYVKPTVIVDGKISTTFGGADAAGARTRSFTRSAADNFTIATRTQPNLSAYTSNPTPITADNNTTNPANTVRHYVIPAGTTWNDNIPLIQASDPNSTDIVSVYVLGTLNINEEQRINGGYGGAYKFIVGNGGVVNIAEGVTLRSQANQGSGNVGEIHILPGGTIQGKGKLEFSNGTNSYNYNGGTIKVGTINNNGGTLYNAGTLQADIMEGGAGLSIYENAGKVHIGKCVKGSTTANTRIHNNCWWEVDQELYCRNIVQGPGAYIKADDLGMTGSADGTEDASYIYAKANSLIEITHYVAFNNVIIDGPTGSDYAYLQFGEATGSNRTDLGSTYHDNLGIAMNYTTAWSNGVETMTTAVSDNIRVSFDVTNDGGNIYQPNPYGTFLNLLNGTRSLSASVNEYISELPQVGNGNAVLVQKNQYTAATVEESECSPGITVVPPVIITNENPIYSYAFEDSNLKSDYDMNDVVIKVQVNAENENLLDVWLVAAGCEYDNEVYLGDTKIEWDGGSEVHDALGVDHGRMINTGSRSTSATAVKTTIAKPSGYDPQTAPWSIVPSGGDMAGKHINIATSGNPCGIVIPADWQWPIERVFITVAYPNFAAWAAKSEGYIENWYDYPETPSTKYVISN